MNTLIARLASNKHATWSVAAYAALEAINQVLDLWFPGYAVKTDETIRILSKAIVCYAILMTAHQPTPPPPSVPEHLTPQETLTVPIPKQ